jgi:acyl carrier protein
VPTSSGRRPHNATTFIPVWEELRALLADSFGVDVEQITPETSFIDDFGLDSLDIVEIVMKLEEYGFNIPMENPEAPIKTVGDLLDYIHRNRQERAATSE